MRKQVVIVTSNGKHGQFFRVIKVLHSSIYYHILCRTPKDQQKLVSITKSLYPSCSQNIVHLNVQHSCVCSFSIIVHLHKISNKLYCVPASVAGVALQLSSITTNKWHIVLSKSFINIASIHIHYTYFYIFWKTSRKIY